jgi:DNA-directed RNA polymerase subunit RPC12/RpoP
MSACCPICKKDVETFVMELLPDISVDQAFTCPYCGAKLVGVAEVEIYVTQLAETNCVDSTGDTK